MQKKRKTVYNILRFVYKEHFQKLLDFKIQSSENIVALGIIFESLFLKSMNQLYLHLRSIGVFPIDIALEWMAYCFIGFLDIKEVYVVLDRIMGYETT